jgi:L-glyceraldehyde 3-phosphate reductase
MAINSNRYGGIPYRRCGKTGLKLPAVSIGLWQNFGDETSFQKVRDLCLSAFNLGITHFDLGNNYGLPAGSAEANLGRLLREDLASCRDELVIATKAGYRMWPGPYGEWGSRKYLIASCDQSLKRLGLDYVDIFYSHRVDPETPLEETMSALDSIVRQGKALYVGISSYGPERTKEAAAILKQMGTPAIIHQPSYSLLNRWTEEANLLDTLETEGMGCIAFSPMAQGLLTNKYLGKDKPENSRAVQGTSMKEEHFNPAVIAQVEQLNEIAKRRGQSLAQMAVSWVLRDPRMTSALIGVSRVQQIVEAVEAASNISFSSEELKEIDRYAIDANVDLWRGSSTS